MLAPKYIPTHLQIVNQDQGLQKHQRKLAEIQSDDRKRKVVDKEAPAKAKLFETREKNLKFHNSEKALAIEKDNEILLGRLVEISRKKKNNFVPLSKSSHLPKTLNGPSRQREKDRIALENEAFAKRLLSQQAIFNRKKLDVDYGKHISLVKQMQRLDNPSTRKLKLPPLHDRKTNPTEDEKEDLAEEEERKEKEKEENQKKEKEEQERKEKEEKEEKEKEEREKHAREEAEKQKKEVEERQRKEKEEKEKKEKEEEERKEKEEREKKEKEELEKNKDQTEEKKDGNDDPNAGLAKMITLTKTPGEIENEKREEEEKAKIAKEEENKKWEELDRKDGDNPMLGMMRGMVANPK